MDRARALGVEFDPGEIDALGAYLGLLLESNRLVNLTAVRDPLAAWDRHVLDSLTLIGVLSELGDAVDVLDVGTGAGLPGSPLAIAMPRARFVLLDATGKKTAFCAHAVRVLGLGNVEVRTGRAEALAHDRGVRGASGREGGHRDRYHAVVSRAVGRVATLAELTLPFARVGGLALLIKGQRADAELAEARQALHLLHAAHAGTVETPTGRIVVLEKLRPTPRVYPRRSGEPKRAPLGVAT